MKSLILFYLALLLKDNYATPCDVSEGKDPCLYKNNVKLPYIATRHPSIRYTSDTHDDRYCDLFALVHGQWYSTFYNMTAYCVEHRSCGTSDPIYLNGTIPLPSDGVVNRTACVRTFEHCCEDILRLRIKNCHYFMVYCFEDLLPACHSRVCLDTDTSFETTAPSTKATTTTTSTSSASIKHISKQSNKSECHNDLVIAGAVFGVVLAISLAISAYLVWKVYCLHRVDGENAQNRTTTIEENKQKRVTVNEKKKQQRFTDISQETQENISVSCLEAD